jgi:hypothetical protein
LVPDVLGNTDHNIVLQGVSALDFAEIDRLLAVMPQVDFNFFNKVSSFGSEPKHTISESQSTAGSDYNFMFDDFSFIGTDFETSTPHSSPSPTHSVQEEIPTSIGSDFTLSHVTLSAAPPAQLLEQQPEGPCQTMHCHVPSTHKQVLDAIGSSKSCVCLLGDVGEENSLSGMKQKAGAISGANK